MKIYLFWLVTADKVEIPLGPQNLESNEAAIEEALSLSGTAREECEKLDLGTIQIEGLRGTAGFRAEVDVETDKVTFLKMYL